MKKQLYIVTMSILFGTCLLLASCGAAGIVSDPGDNKDPGGTGSQSWHQATAAAGWSPRTFVGAAAYNNQLWIIGGGTSAPYLNDVWSSADGASWTQKTPSANWSKRVYPKATVFNNQLWVIGGSDASSLLNDVWSSTDGIAWTQKTPSANWSKRVRQGLVVFNNKLWIMGGFSTAGAGKHFNDVWSSTDGTNWTQETASANWSVRESHELIVFNNKLWLMGGAGSGGYTDTKNDIWSTTDGQNWVEEVASANWRPRSGHSLAVYDNKIWLIGGYIGQDNLTVGDIWQSENGIDWTTEILPEGQWWNTATTDHGSFTLNNRLWVFGVSGSSGVWYYP